jgi:hypothetical protein
MVVCGFSCVGLVDVGAAAPIGGCASMQRPQDPWWATASWGGFVACMAWVKIFRRQCGEVVGSADLLLAWLV